MKDMLFNTKRSQIQTHLFIYILAILVLALILLFGYRAIDSFRDKGKQATMLTFKTSLANEVERVSLSFGEVSIVDYTLPTEYSEICFVDSSVINSKDYAKIPSTYPIIQGAVESGSENNVFLVSGISEPFSNVGQIKVTNFFKCARVMDGKFRLRFEWSSRGTTYVKVCGLDDPMCETEV